MYVYVKKYFISKLDLLISFYIKLAKAYFP